MSPPDRSPNPICALVWVLGQEGFYCPGDWANTQFIAEIGRALGSELRERVLSCGFEWFDISGDSPEWDAALRPSPLGLWRRRKELGGGGRRQGLRRIGHRSISGGRENHAVVLNMVAQRGQSGSPVIDAARKSLVAVLIGAYARDRGVTVRSGGMDVTTPHQTTHAVSAHYLERR